MYLDAMCPGAGTCSLFPVIPPRHTPAKDQGVAAQLQVRKGDSCEENVSAFQRAAQADPWFPRPHGHARRACSDFGPAAQGPPSPDGVVGAVNQLCRVPMGFHHRRASRALRNTSSSSSGASVWWGVISCAMWPGRRVPEDAGSVLPSHARSAMLLRATGSNAASASSFGRTVKALNRTCCWWWWQGPARRNSTGRSFPASWSVCCGAGG